jgi:putative modified peptide
VPASSSIKEGTAMQLTTRTSTTATTAVVGQKRESAPMTTAAAIKLVDLLSTDDAFRDAFMHDARPALEAWGFDPYTCDFFWYDCKIGITSLASKATIAAAREEIIAMLMRNLNQTTPQLDSGLDSKRRLK